jgi:hypothetical protein
MVSSKVDMHRKHKLRKGFQLDPTLALDNVLCPTLGLPTNCDAKLAQNYDNCITREAA